MPATDRISNRLLLTYCIFVFLVLGLSACNSYKRKYIIPQNKFVDVLVDIHLADAIALNYYPQYPGFELDSVELYGSVFAKHGVTRIQFDSTISYYGARPDEFHEIYTRVTAKLYMLTEETLNPVSPAQQTESDEKIWEDPGIYALPEMGETNRVEINVPIKEAGEYIITADIKIYTDDESVNPRISVYYWYDNNTPLGFRDFFPEILLNKDGNQTTYQTSKTLVNSEITHIKGYILNHSNQDTSFKKHALVSEISVIYRQ